MTTLGADCYYTGDPFTLNLHIDTALQSGYSVEFVMIQFNGVSLVYKDESDFGTPGSYDFQYDTTAIWPFITALGEPVHIHVNVMITAETSAPHPDPASVTFTGTITNI